MKLQELTLRKVRLPLTRPYELSYRTFTEFEPIIVEARDTDGRRGWGEGHVSPGSSGEIRDGAGGFFAANMRRRSSGSGNACRQGSDRRQYRPQPAE